MFRKFITFICLMLMLGVTGSWIRSLTTSEAYTWNIASEWAVIARHAQGVLTLACKEAGIILSMPHWLALALLAVWPLFHLRVKMDDRKLVAKKR